MLKGVKSANIKKECEVCYEEEHKEMYYVLLYSLRECKELLYSLCELL
jgi:hypothetical protein